MAQYIIRTYDTYFNDVRSEHMGEYVDDETAINAAKRMLHLFIHPTDTCEMQVCRKGMAIGEWCMFAAVYYCDGDIVVDDCFC
jgi:hypothetical protein